MMEKASKKRLLMLIVILCLTGLAFIYIIAFAGKGANPLQAESGMLDLADWNGGLGGVVQLSGEWEFYWNRLLSPQEVTYGGSGSNSTGGSTGGSLIPDLIVDAPSVWNSYQIDGQNLPAFGYATYLLRVVNALPGEPLALRVQPLSAAYQLYIDGHLAAASGKVATDKAHYAPESRPQVVEFTPTSPEFTLMVQVANYTCAQGGMYSALNLGTPGQIAGQEQGIADRNLFLMGVLCVMVVYYIGIFLFGWWRDKSSLYFTLLCIILAGNTAISGDYLIYRLIPSISFEAMMAMSYLILCWLYVCCTLIVGALFPEESFKKVVRAAVGYGLVMTLIILITPVTFYTRLIYIAEPVAFLLNAYCIIILTRAFLKGRKDALIILPATLAASVFTVHDLVLQSNVSDLGILILMLLQPFILARRFSDYFSNLKASMEKTMAAELAFTQAQIKPHFLYNTLTAVASLCGSDPGRAQELIVNFSDYLRYSFDPKNLEAFGSLEREISFVKAYTEIEKARFGDQLKVEFEFDSPLDIRVPLLTVQPLVENAINHGYRKKGGGGTVTISVKNVPAGAEVAVTDDGQGIAPERMAKLFSPGADHGIGLENIDRRLKKWFGQGLTIESIPGKGTRVSYRVPREYCGSIHGRTGSGEVRTDDPGSDSG